MRNKTYANELHFSGHWPGLACIRSELACRFSLGSCPQGRTQRILHRTCNRRFRYIIPGTRRKPYRSGPGECRCGGRQCPGFQYLQCIPDTWSYRSGQTAEDESGESPQRHPRPSRSYNPCPFLWSWRPDFRYLGRHSHQRGGCGSPERIRNLYSLLSLLRRQQGRGR